MVTKATVELDAVSLATVLQGLSALALAVQAAQASINAQVTKQISAERAEVERPKDPAPPAYPMPDLLP